MDQDGLPGNAMHMGDTDPNGFDARVESMWHAFGRMKSELGFWSRWRARRRMDRFVRSINEWLALTGSHSAGWDQVEGGVVCHIRVAKMGLVSTFQKYLGRAVEPDCHGEWRHLLGIRDSRCLMVPLDFRLPFPISGDAGGTPFWVVSAKRILSELEAVNACLRIGTTRLSLGVVDHLNATAREISAYEACHGLREKLWPEFTFLMLKRLVDVSVARGLPVIIGGGILERQSAGQKTKRGE
jgi:hypothetical protein